jgi:hypothetical protein
MRKRAPASCRTKAEPSFHALVIDKPAMLKLPS